LKEYPLITAEPVDELLSIPLDPDDDNGEVDAAWWRYGDFSLVANDVLESWLQWMDQVSLAWDEKDPWSLVIPFDQAILPLAKLPLPPPWAPPTKCQEQFVK
jgi:hypothetical protein